MWNSDSYELCESSTDDTSLEIESNEIENNDSGRII
jgi:hypothetical protein